MNKVICDIIEAGLVAVIRAENADKAKQKAKLAIDSGVLAVEITFTVPDAAFLISQLKTEYNGKGVLVGAGTVTNRQQAEEAAKAGADFAVSPGYFDAAAQVFKEKEIEYIPGVYTPTEIGCALDKGYQMLKLFPGDLALLKALKAPFPNVKFMVTGGVSVLNLNEFLSAGASAIGAGSNLFPKQIQKTGAEIKKWLDILKAFKGGN